MEGGKQKCTRSRSEHGETHRTVARRLDLVHGLRPYVDGGVPAGGNVLQPGSFARARAGESHKGAVPGSLQLKAKAAEEAFSYPGRELVSRQ